MDSAGILAYDLEELNLDRPSNALKSVEELQQLTVDEGLTDIERAVYLLSSGQEVQRISVITALPSLLKDNNAECMRRVVPKVREVLYVAQQDMQVAAASAFLQILVDKLVPLHSYTQTFLQTILTSVDSKDPEVSAAWLGTLLDVIDLLPTEIIKKDILGIAISKGQLQQPVAVRLSCCKILGKIATKFESFLIKKEILPVVQQLCQDVEHEVRACMCGQLDSVACGLGLENMKSAILPELVELTNDEESDVRISGLHTVVNILSILDHDTLTTTIVPLVVKVCQKALQADDCTLPAVASHLGQLYHGLQGNLTEEQRHWFMDYYKKLCKVGLTDKQKAAEKYLRLNRTACGNDLDCSWRYQMLLITSNTLLLSSCDEEDRYIETRKHAAYNFPAMAQVVGAKYFKAELLGTMSALCRDPHFLVRKTIAAGIHEVAKMMGNMATVLFTDLATLLTDESIEVLEGVVSTFPSCVEMMSKSLSTLSETKLHSLQEMVVTYLSAEPVVFSGTRWRLQEAMMTNLGTLSALCSQDLLHSAVMPLLMDKMKQGRALPVRHAAARSLLVVMRCLHRLEWREQIIHTLIQDFCQGRSCHRRALFLHVCRQTMALYSRSFFKQHLFHHTLSLTSDPVANIRRGAVTLLPGMKRLLRLPAEHDLKASLEQCVRHVLIKDTDRDVIAAIRQAVEEMDGIHVQIESMVAHRQSCEEDVEDQAKENEERHLLEVEEQERKEEERNTKKSSKKDNSRLPGLKKTSSLTKGQAGVKADLAPARKDSKGPPPPAAQSAVNGGSGNSASGPPSLLPHMIRSKSTTSIPSLSHIPRPEARPSTPPRKEVGSTRIPVYHSLPRTEPLANRAAKVRASVTTSGNNPTTLPVLKGGRRVSKP